MSNVAESNGPPTIAQTTAQAIIAPQWLAVAMFRNLRAVSIRGGVAANVPTPIPSVCLFAAQANAIFR